MKSLRKILQKGAITVLTALMLVSPANAAIIFQDDNFETIYSSGLLIDSMNQATGDIAIQFGDTLGESIQWDQSNNWFEFSDDVSLNSNQLVQFRVENVSSLPGGGSGLGTNNIGRMVQLTTADSVAPGCTVSDCLPGTYVWNGVIWQAYNISCSGVFPTVESMTTNTFSSTTTTHNVTMPATVMAGDLLIVFFTNDGNATVTTPSGWTAMGTLTRDIYARGSVYAKIANGTEGGTTVNFITSATEQAAAQTYRILGASWYGSITNGIALQSYDPGTTTTTPNPPSLSPPWGAADSLWIAYAAGSSWTSVNSYPASYTNGTHTISSTGTAGASTSTARRQLNAENENPGAFTMSVSASGVVFTVAVRPLNCGAVSGGGGGGGSTYFASGVSEAESSTTSGSYQNKLTVTPTFTNGVRYKIDYQFELGATGDSDTVYRVQVGGTTVGEGVFKNYPYSTRYEPQSGFYYATNLSGSQAITIDYYLTYGTTAYIRRARIFVTAYPD
jgi:hypothetical protein